MNRVLIGESGTRHVDRFDRGGLRPNNGIVVVCRMPIVLKADKCKRNILQSNGGRRLTGTKEDLDLILTDRFHLSMIERSGENAPLPRNVPMTNGLAD